MTNWDSPDEQLRVTNISNKLVYALFGLYAWELVNTMHVESALVAAAAARARRFKWPQILYFICRYSLLLALIGLLSSLSPATSIHHCQALFVFTQWAGNTTIASSTSLLLLRTIAVWNRSPFVLLPMLLLAAAHWALLYYGVTSVKAEWSPDLAECVVTAASPAVLKALYIYTMAFDLVILLMTISGLCFIVPAGRSGLWKLLFTDGIAYFTLVASVNSIPAILNILDLNPAMNVIATVPACVISTIAATRLFRRLQDYTSKDVYVHTSFIAGLPSAAGSNRRWSATQGKLAFPLSAVQNTGRSKTPTETVTGLMPHFASSAPRDWEGHPGAGYPYASARGGESFLSVNEKPDNAAAVGLPTLVSYVFASPREPAPLFRYGSPRLSKLDVQVEVIEMKESVPADANHSDTTITAPQRHYPSSAGDVV